MPKTGNNADAAVKPDVEPNKVTYTAVQLLQYYNPTSKDTQKSISYSMFEGVNDEYGVVTFDEETKTATLNKLSISYHQLLNYIAFKSEITVPAMTEYSIDYSFTATYKRTANSISETMVGMCVFYFGNTYEDPNAQDQSSKVEFKCSTSGTNTPAEYVVGDYSSTTNTAKTSTGEISTITYTNDTNEAATYTAYFGVSSYGSAGSTYANTNTTSLVMSDKLTVTAIDVPTVDKKSADFNPKGNTFNFTYDHDRVVLSSVTHKGFSSAAQDVSGEVFIDENGGCLLTDAGVYTFNFDIADYCGAVWNSDTNDQTTKKIEITINTPTVDIPYVANDERPYTGATQAFTLYEFDTDKVKVEKVEPGNTSNSVTAAGGGAIVATTSSFEALNADTYTITLKLADADNYVWSDEQGGNGTRTLTFTITKKDLKFTFDCSEKNSAGNAEWEYGKSDVVITATADSIDGDQLSLVFYYDSKTNHLEASTSGKISEISMPSTIATGEHALVVDFSDNSGANANYEIVSGSYSFNVKAASVDTSYSWKYYEGTTDKGAIAEGAEISYKLNTTFSVEIVIPSDQSYIEVGDYSDEKGSKVGSYKTTVTLTSTDEKNLFSDGNGGYTDTTTLTLNWSIVQKEIDLTKVPFEYNDGENGWIAYKSDNPPQISDNKFSVRIPDANLPEGVTSVTASNYVNAFGPGTIKFDFEFVLDDNYKSSTGSNTVAYSMETTGKQIKASWKLSSLKDADGEDICDEYGVPYYVYYLDIDPSDPVYPFINYEYYTDGGSSYGEIISGGLDTVIAPVEDGGMGASSQNSIIIYVRAYIGPDKNGNPAPTTNGVANYYLKFSDSDPEYKKMTVGTDKRVVDLSEGDLTYITYGETADLNKLYSVIVRTTNAPLNTSLYTVAFYNDDDLIEEDIKNVDFSKLNASVYKLVFALTDSAKEDYVLTKSSLNFTVKPVELTVPTLKDGATFTFNGDTQGITSSLDN
ncbi:MAG: hypothetical protein K2H30_00560, partial [Clostridia bacterium]|nr:hypothetical protein [Clostridia bacterium]